MSIGVTLVVGLVSCAGLVEVVGTALPETHVATVSATIPAAPSAVWAAIVDFDHQETWRRGVRDVRSTRAGFEEEDRWGEVTAFAVDERVEGQRLVTRVLGDGAFGGTWTIEVAPDPGGSRVTVTERGEIRSAPLRVLAWLVFDLSSTARGWLVDLGAPFGGAAR